MTPIIPFLWRPKVIIQSVFSPDLNIIENFAMHYAHSILSAYSYNTMSFHAVEIPKSFNFNGARAAISGNIFGKSHTYHLGLYYLTGSTLSLSVSASGTHTVANASSWISLAPGASSLIQPGSWYIGFNVISTSGDSGVSFVVNSPRNPVNAIPTGLVLGRMTVSTGALPSSINTTNLDVTGLDAISQPFFLLTA
jgi:hypothetical protein